MTDDQMSIVQSAADLYRRSPVAVEHGPACVIVLADADVLAAILMLAEAAPTMLAEIARLRGMELREVSLH